MYKRDFLEIFKTGLLRDQKAGIIQEWMKAWYWKELFPEHGDSQGFDGPIEIVKWYLGLSTSHKFPSVFDAPEITELADKVLRFEERVFAHELLRGYTNLIGQIDFRNYATYTAQDYFFQKRIPMGGMEPIKRVMDFGAGSGRQCALWTQNPDLDFFVSVDALPQTYCMQYTYYTLAGIAVREYFLSESDLEFRSTGPADFLHIPSWTLDKIDPEYLDVVFTVQVLGELRPEMLDWTIKQFFRMLRPGGRLYVRDHGARHNPNKVNIPDALRDVGFRLEYEPYLTDFEHIHGVPKLWCKP